MSQYLVVVMSFFLMFGSLVAETANTVAFRGGGGGGGRGYGGGYRGGENYEGGRRYEGGENLRRMWDENAVENAYDDNGYYDDGNDYGDDDYETGESYNQELQDAGYNQSPVFQQSQGSYNQGNQPQQSQGVQQQPTTWPGGYQQDDATPYNRSQWEN